MKATRLSGLVLAGVCCLGMRAAVSTLADPAATEVCGPLSGDTRWTIAGSPYRLTCDVVVPAHVRLTIEAGTEVQLGPMHRLLVEGALQAVGTDAAPIRFVAADPEQPWSAVQMAPNSGPSELSHVHFSGGGAGRREMLGIESGAVTISDCRFGKNAGVAVEIKGGASPTIRHSAFVQANDPGADPPAALRIRGPSDAVITENAFESNDFAVFWEANANPRFEGNRFAFNGHDGVLVTGRITRDVQLRSLGPRNWSYAVLSPGLVIEAGGSLLVGPGTTMKFFPGNGIRVAGTLAIRGRAADKVLLTTAASPPSPGQWTDIEFSASSVDYVPEIEEGCTIEHAILEYGGGRQTGVIHVRASSPRLAHNLIRHSGRRGITVTGAEALPEIVGNLFDANTHDPDGVAVFVTGGAMPTLAFNIFRNNTIGVRAERSAEPLVEPHNWFDRNLQYGVYNEDSSVCVSATENDWGVPSGPNDPADLPGDACGMTSNDSPDGDLVSNHVRYFPWEGVLPRPVLTSPRCGSTAQGRPVIAGTAPSGATVHIYDNGELLGSTTTAPGGGERNQPFQFVPSGLAPGSHVLRAQTERGSERSGLSEPLELFVDPEQAIDPSRLTISYDLDGTHFVQPYINASGCISLGSGDWRMRVHPVDRVTLRAAIACPGGDIPRASLSYAGADWPMQSVGDEMYAATFPLGEGGPVSIRFGCGAGERSVVLGTLEREYNGIVYDAELGPALGRIAGAQVTLYEWDASRGDWRVWPGREYHGQTNPITTGAGGWIIFYPPPGLYYARAVAPGYEPGVTSEVTILTEPFVANLALKRSARGIALPYLLRSHTLAPQP